MKKTRIFLLTIFTFAIGINLVNAETTIRLTDIANAFNERDDVQIVEQLGLTIDAIADEANSTLTIEVSDGEETASEVYTLTGNILSITIVGTGDDDSSMWTSVFDTVGMLHGYEEGWRTHSAGAAESGTIPNGAVAKAGHDAKVHQQHRVRREKSPAGDLCGHCKCPSDGCEHAAHRCTGRFGRDPVRRPVAKAFDASGRKKTESPAASRPHR